MLSDEQLQDTMRDRLHGLAGDLEPDPRLYERVLAGHARRRRARGSGRWSR